jgi:hypothetical protein
VLQRVEADRRGQMGRAVAAAERRVERDQLQASIEDLNQRGGRIKLNGCGNSGDSGDRKRLCVLVDQTAGRFGNAQSGEIHMIAKGY